MSKRGAANRVVRTRSGSHLRGGRDGVPSAGGGAARAAGGAGAPAPGGTAGSWRPWWRQTDVGAPLHRPRRRRAKPAVNRHRPSTGPRSRGRGSTSGPGQGGREAPAAPARGAMPVPKIYDKQRCGKPQTPGSTQRRIERPGPPQRERPVASPLTAALPPRPAPSTSTSSTPMTADVRAIDVRDATARTGIVDASSRTHPLRRQAIARSTTATGRPTPRPPRPRRPAWGRC